MPEGNGYAREGDAEGAPPDALLGSEQWQWEAIPNLDQFFTRVYRWVLQGCGCVCGGVCLFVCVIVERARGLGALAAAC